MGREVLLVHPGGPFWARKDVGTWSLPKGEPDAGEDRVPVRGASSPKRPASRSPTGTLDAPRLRGLKRGKRVLAGAFAATSSPAAARATRSSSSGRRAPAARESFPEIDRSEFFGLEAARAKINPAQAEFLDRLEALLAAH